MRRATRVFGIVEARGSGVRVGTKVIDVEILLDTHHVSISVACVVEGSICVATDGSTSVRKLATSIWLIWLVEGVCVVVSCLLPSSAYSRMIATVGMEHIATAGTDWGEVAHVETVIVYSTAAIHVAVNWLFPSVMTTAVMEPSLVELVGSNLTKGILIFSCSSAKVATVALVNWITGSSRCPLLSQFSLSNRFWNRVTIRVVCTGTWTWEHDIIATRIEKLRSHHHLLLLACVCVWGLPLIDQI